MKTLAAVILLAASAGTQAGVAQINQANSLQNLKTMIRAGSITKVQVLHLPDDVLTPVSVTPKSLRFTAYYTICFNRDIAGTFEPLLSGLSTKPENHIPDLRWGVLFYDAENHEVGSIFVDGFGHYGYLDDRTVSFHSGNLEKNLSQRLHAMIRNLR